MAQLNADQAFELAKGFHDLSVAIGNFRFSQGDALTDDQQKQLEDLQFDVLNDSTKFNGMSISLELDDLQGTLDQIKDATDKMQNAIQHLKDVGKIINIATAGVTLGAAVVSMNPGAVFSAIGGAITAVNE
jgi:hypothetical protein